MAWERLAGGQRREQIFEAAVQVSSRKGFAGTTTRELAREARVSEAMILCFFPHKAARYRAIIGRFIATADDPFPPRAPGRFGRTLPFALLLILAVPGLMAACSGGASAGREGQGAPAGRAAQGGPGGNAPGARVFRVTSAPVTLQDVTYTIEAVGSIEAEAEVQVVAGVEGIVTSVRFREGDAVTPSSILATIDPERYRVQAERARASYERFQAQHRQALADLRRREELSLQTPPLISQEEVERARQEAEQLRASVAEARALFDLAEQDRRRSIVRPLVPGIINSKSVIVGQHVESKAVLATLVDTRQLNLRFSVSEKESTRLREGMAVGFTTDSRPGQEFGARLFHVSSTADPATRMVECFGRVEKAADLLKPGFFAEVRADVESHKGAIVIPERAVLPTDRGFVTFEVRDGVAVRRPVALGLRTRGGGVEILSGLDRDAVVVTDGGDILKDGAPVQEAAREP